MIFFGGGAPRRMAHSIILSLSDKELGVVERHVILWSINASTQMSKDIIDLQ